MATFDVHGLTSLYLVSKRNSKAKCFLTNSLHCEHNFIYKEESSICHLSKCIVQPWIKKAVDAYAANKQKIWHKYILAS